MENVVILSVLLKQVGVINYLCAWLLAIRFCKEPDILKKDVQYLCYHLERRYIPSQPVVEASIR